MEKMALRRLSPVYFPFLCLLLSITLAVGALSLPPAEAQASLYIEVGDAGDKFSPQILDEEYKGIKGTIGGDDTTDAFCFFWAGGDFHIEIRRQMAFSRITLYEAFFYNREWKSNGKEVWFFVLPETLEPAEATKLSLPIANCILVIGVNATSDPDYTITLLGEGDFQPTISAPVAGVPLPSAILLLGSGLFRLMVCRKRKR